MVFVAVLAGSVFPDMDHPRSSLAQQSILLKGISHAVSGVTVHRGVVHSLLASLLLSAALYAFLVSEGFDGAIAAGFWFGYVSHLLGDSATRSGIKWLQPFSEWRVRGPIKVCSRGEELIFVLLLGLMFYELLWGR